MAEEKKIDPAQIPVSIQWIEHKGEMIVSFSKPVGYWTIPPDTARQFGEQLLDMANRIEPKTKGH
jgi:hypothetical protein